MDPRSLLLALCLAASGPALAAVTVTHADPNRFTDIEDKNSEPERTMREFKAHLESLGKRYAPDKNVAIEVLDIDRAGRPRLRHDVRVMTGKSDFPCIDLASALDGGTMKRERVCDLDYLRTLPPPYNSGEALVFEKRMLDDWFRRRFGDRKP
jgi:hypothetical protein